LAWYEALSRLKEQGKIRAFGVSANDWDPYGPLGLAESGLTDTVQVIYNVFEQRPAERLLPAALAHDVGIIVRVPFEEGLLTGKMGPDYAFDEGDWRAEWLTPERLAEASRRVAALRPFLTEDRPTLAALALKFCLSHPAASTVIPGMRRVAHVEANCAVSDGKLLSDEETEALKTHAFAHGWKYPWSQEE
jgi:aryl-alcohol dehydrogenase-like predicted oxidoreductase